MRQNNILRTWLRIHRTRIAAAELAVASLLSAAVSNVGIEQVGPLVFPVPLLGILVVPVLSGIGAATASVEDFRFPLPHRPALSVLRLVWCLGWVAAAVGISVAGMLVAPNSAASQAGAELAVVRNVLVFSGLSLLLVRRWEGQFIWVPAVVLTLAASMFGFSEARYEWYWWATVFSEEATGLQLMVGIGMVVAAAALNAFGRRRMVGP